MRTPTFLATLLLSLPLVAGAGDWTVKPEGSSLGFTGNSQGEAFQGTFKQFDAKIRFERADR